MPRISVIVPVYKVEKYIHRCIDSILAQTYRNFELILVDDGSPDTCPEICDEYAKKDDRIRVIHQENGGLSAARNAGIDWTVANSDSEWLSFIDSDDWVHPKYLEFLLEAAVRGNAAISACYYQRVKSEIAMPEYSDMKYKLMMPERFWISGTTNAIIACGKLYAKKAFVDTRYPVGRYHEDSFVTHTLLFPNKYIAVVNMQLYYYYNNPNGIMNSYIPAKERDGIEAQSARQEYFRDNGFLSAMKYEANNPSGIIDEMTAIEKGTVQNDRPLYRKLKRRLCRSLIRNRFSINSHEWLYETAFPKFMSLYWLCMAVIRRFKRLLKVEK